MKSFTHSLKTIEKIGFFSPLAGVGVDCGYGYAAVELINAWQRMGIPVWSFDRDAPVIFNMGQPQFYERVEGKLNIGYTPWESTGVPDSWVMYMNRMDEIWTTCWDNAKWYHDAGVTVPIRILHHGLNAEHWPRVRRNWESGPLKFLHIGGDANRKGAHLVYRAFKKTFKDSNAASLTLKGRRLSFDIEGDNVHHMSEMLDIKQLAKLHHQHHAMIYPTNGEGFGLIPFQAAATGMPTVVTDWSGPKDFMEFCFPLPIKGLVEPSYEPHIGLWAEPDFDQLCKFMSDIYHYYDLYADIAYEKAGTMLPDWSWDNLAKTAVEQMIVSLTRLHERGFV